MDQKSNEIHLIIHDNTYYLIDIEKNTAIKNFNLSDFLIDLYEKNYDSLGNCIELILNNDIEHFYAFSGDTLSHIASFKCSIVFDIKLKSISKQPLEVYTFESYHDFVLFVIYKAASSNIQFNKCRNCGKYFVPTAKSNEIYCTRIYRNNKTCRDIGYENSVQSDEISKAYRNAYKTQNAKKQRNKDVSNIDEQFSEWASSAKEMYKLCKDNKIKLDKFSKWLKDNQDWISK